MEVPSGGEGPISRVEAGRLVRSGRERGGGVGKNGGDRLEVLRKSGYNRIVCETSLVSLPDRLKIRSVKEGDSKPTLRNVFVKTCQRVTKFISPEYQNF